MVIGRYPVLEELGFALCRRGGESESTTMENGFAPCGLAVIDFETPLSAIAPGKGRLRLFMTPEDLCTLTGLKNVQLPYILGDLMKERYIFEEDEKNKAYSLSSIRMGKTILSKIEEKRVFKMHIQVARMLEKQHQKDDMWMKAADHYYHGKETGKTLHLSLEVARWLMTQKRFSMALRDRKSVV